MKYNILAFKGDTFAKWCQPNGKKEMLRIISFLINDGDYTFVLTDNKGVEDFIQELTQKGPYGIIYRDVKKRYNMYFNEKGDFVHAE